MLALPWQDNSVSAWTCEAFVSPYSAPARTAESRTSVQDIIDTPSVSKASGTKRGAVSLAPSGWSMHKTRALRHSLRWRTLKRTDLHCLDFTATAPPPYVENCHYSHLSEFCTRQQYEKFWGQDTCTLLLANDFVCAWKTHLEGQGRGADFQGCEGLRKNHRPHVIFTSIWSAAGCTAPIGEAHCCMGVEPTVRTFWNAVSDSLAELLSDWLTPQ